MTAAGAAPRLASSGPGFIALEGGDARVEVVPTHGGRIRSLRLGGREWLLQGAAHEGPLGGAAPGANAGALGGAGWDECAPAAGAGTVPEYVKGIGGRPVPAGGEARLQVPEVELRTGVEGHTLRCTWRGDRLPWTLTRTLFVRPDGAVEARYEATATGTQRLPFLWSACLLMPFDARTQLRMPDARFRVQSLAGAESTVTSGSTHQWPRLPVDGRARDLSAPWQLPRKVMVTGWLDLASTRSALQVRQQDRQLTITMDGEGVPHCGIVLDRGGLRTGIKRGFLARGTAPALALMPSLGAPDRYAEALGDWQSVTWLAPGEPRHWTMVLRAEKHP